MQEKVLGTLGGELAVWLLWTSGRLLSLVPKVTLSQMTLMAVLEIWTTWKTIFQ
jgi:hypothetical protein